MSKARSLQQQHLNLKKKSAFKWKSLLPHKQGEVCLRNERNS